MQKHHFIFLFSFLLIFSVSEAALAAIISLPRYQGSIAHKYTDRTQSGGKDKVEVSCSSRGGYAKGSHQTCSGLFMVNGQTCYKSCTCSDGYKANASGACVAKTCSDYGLKLSPDATMSCKSVSKAPNLTCHECVACDTSVYKYACSGGLNASVQQGSACNKLYSGCGCVANASWNSTSGKCVCGDDYKASASGSSCIAKTCEDYGYLTDEVDGQSCLEMIPNDGYHPIGQNARCFLCSACDSSYKYDCSSITNNNGGDGTACGGKYAKCKCKDLYRWDNGNCTINCTRNSCSTTTYPLTVQNAANAISYDECTPSCSDEPKRYKVSSCAANYNVNSAGSACEANPDCSITPLVPPTNATCNQTNTCELCTSWKCDSGYYKRLSEITSDNIDKNICVDACMNGTISNSSSAYYLHENGKIVHRWDIYYITGDINASDLALIPQGSRLVGQQYLSGYANQVSECMTRKPVIYFDDNSPENLTYSIMNVTLDFSRLTQEKTFIVDGSIAPLFENNGGATYSHINKSYVHRNLDFKTSSIRPTIKLVNKVSYYLQWPYDVYDGSSPGLNPKCRNLFDSPVAIDVNFVIDNSEAIFGDGYDLCSSFGEAETPSRIYNTIINNVSLTNNASLMLNGGSFSTSSGRRYYSLSIAVKDLIADKSAVALQKQTYVNNLTLKDSVFIVSDSKSSVGADIGTINAEKSTICVMPRFYKEIGVNAISINTERGLLNEMKGPLCLINQSASGLTSVKSKLKYDAACKNLIWDTTACNIYKYNTYTPNYPSYDENGVLSEYRQESEMNL